MKTFPALCLTAFLSESLRRMRSPGTLAFPGNFVLAQQGDIGLIAIPQSGVFFPVSSSFPHNRLLD